MTFNLKMFQMYILAEMIKVDLQIHVHVYIEL